MVQVLKQGFCTTIYTTNLMTTVVVCPPSVVLCNNNKVVGEFMDEKYREGMNVLSSMQFQFRIQILFILSSSVLFLSLIQLVVSCTIRPLYICIHSKIDGVYIPRRERCMHAYLQSLLVGTLSQEKILLQLEGINLKQGIDIRFGKSQLLTRMMMKEQSQPSPIR